MDGLARLRALQALAAAGLPPPGTLERASSVTNEVWLTGDMVVRVGRRNDGRLCREASLTPHLPAGLGHPEVIACSPPGGRDWLVSRRVPGTVLSRCWPSMTVTERRTAVRQLARRLRLLHATPSPPDLAPIVTPQLLDAGSPTPLAPLARALRRARRMPHLDTSLLDAVEALVLECAPALVPFHDTTLVHGDLTFENVLWDGDAVSAILDFEWARGAPPDVDLDVLLRMCAYPFLHVAADYAPRTLARDYADVPRWLAEDYGELFARPRVHQRLTVFDVRELLAAPSIDAGTQPPPYHPLTRLTGTLRGTNHLRWLDRAAV
jgi:hygromycin-B 7''-O-kinase